MNDFEVISFLLEGDPSIQYQTRKYLLGETEAELSGLRQSISKSGWGRMYLDAQNEDLSFGKGFYAHKWTSTHYSLLDLRYLEIPRETESLVMSVRDITKNCRAGDGGVTGTRGSKHSDVCVNGMFLNYGAYFHMEDEPVKTIVDLLSSQVLPDGGFNCQDKSTHSSVHTTLSVLEGFLSLIRYGYTYRIEDIMRMKRTAEEFLLSHHLFRSSTTGDVMNENFIQPAYPPRWKYDILKALWYFADVGIPFDSRMEDALLIIEKLRTKDGTLLKGKTISGELHFRMEEGKAGRWNPMRAMRVLQHYARLTVNE
ncbi:hypothetical protein [Youngiibacter fragilis]|uniref:Uncharacterized protein n=1 Tax=Youngiibacter fragilis 232.1 TaxID=994573 RepID=V7I301_9CLOT|nr:hypothetical protein [Youngiibacter fragilis]ETA79574.1 hypothetical protein T472_0216285 [Youngiibacter fragilis 232.1]